MTVAPATLAALQAKLVKNLGTVNLGIVGDAAHVATGGYHIGAKSLREHGMANDYSLQFSLDRNAQHDYACAIDIGGSPELLMKLGQRMKNALQNKDSRVYNKVRAINSPFDGDNDDRRIDTENPENNNDTNIQSSSDQGHIHLEVYRTLVNDLSVMNGIYNVFAGVPSVLPFLKSTANTAIRDGNIPMGTHLNTAKFIASPNGRIKLEMRSNGTLILTGHGGETLWQVITGHQRAFVVFKTDQIVFCEWIGREFKQIAHFSAGAVRYEVQDDGNFVAYSATGAVRWQTKSNKY